MTSDNIVMQEGLKAAERWAVGQVQVGREWATCVVKFYPRSRDTSISLRVACSQMQLNNPE